MAVAFESNTKNYETRAEQEQGDWVTGGSRRGMFAQLAWKHGIIEGWIGSVGEYEPSVVRMRERRLVLFSRFRLCVGMAVGGWVPGPGGQQVNDEVAGA